MVNHSDASFFSFFKKITSSNDNNNNEQVFDKNNKPIELKIQVNSSILEQIKEINNILENKNNNNKIKDSNFDTIQTQQQHILGVLESYHYNKDVFNKCIVKVKSTISVIDFYNTLFRKRNDFSKLIVELYDILKDQYSKSINELFNSFSKILNMVNLINLIFNEKNNGGLINNLLLLDNTVGLNENEIKNILSPYFHQLDLILDKDTIDYYNDVLSEVNVKIRQKNSVLPSQLLFILFTNIRDELLIKNNELYESYIFFKNKITIINQKLDAINTYIKDNKQLSVNNNNEKNHEEAIVNLINSNIKEQNRSNSDVIDEIDRVRSAIGDIIESLSDFKNYVPDEKILSAIEQAKTNKTEYKNQNNKISDNNSTKKSNITKSKSESSNTTTEENNKDKNNSTNSNNKDNKDKNTENKKIKLNNDNKNKDLNNKESKDDNKSKDKNTKNNNSEKPSKNKDNEK